MPHAKKIAFFINSLALGGTAKVLFNFIVGLRAEGIETEVIILKREGEYLPLFERSGIRVIDLQCKSHNAIGALRLKLHLKESKPNILIAMGRARNIGAVLAAWNMRKNLSIVLTEHGIPSYTSLNPRHSFFKKAMMLGALNLSVKIFYPFADHIISVSEGTAEGLRKQLWVGKSKVRVIYNPIVTPELIQQAEMPVSHIWLKEKSVPVILGVGRLHPIKDWMTLLSAFQALKRHTAAKLIILGDGPQRTELTKWIGDLGLSEDVDLAGFTENPYAFMHSADAFVSSSRYESLPTVLVEAMACGCQIVATDCPGGTREILQNGAFGTLVPVGDKNALENALHDVLKRKINRLPSLLIQRAQDFSVATALSEYNKMLYFK